MLNSHSASVASTPSAHLAVSMPSTRYPGSAEPSEAINSKEQAKQNFQSQLGIIEYRFSDPQPLCAAYQLNQAVLQALSTYETHEWSEAKPTKMAIIELFISKSAWHDGHAQYFPRAECFENMVAWLKGGMDASSDLIVWGSMKKNFSFKDLAKWLTEKENESSDDSSDEKKELKKKSKGKGKAKENSKRLKSRK